MNEKLKQLKRDEYDEGWMMMEVKEDKRKNKEKKRRRWCWKAAGSTK
jgi:hypothetical protein